MNNDLSLLKTLKIQGFTNIDIDQILNYLETLSTTFALYNHFKRLKGKVIANELCCFFP